ncbi:MAG: hypothetical protein GEV00_23470, partial [Actinophytocola sp.]|nr:hypothetical protein [Actinophytocola sp.]
MVDINRDQYGRPLVPDPATGNIRAWTRVTTLAATISDRHALERWAQRNLIKGIAAREELVLRAAAAGDDRAALDSIVDAALEAAKTSSAADIGTALHRLTERHDAGEDIQVPAAYQDDIKSYIHVLAESGVKVVPEW